MDDFEWIEKDELIENKPNDDVVRPPVQCDDPQDVPGTAHDMPTQEEEVTAPSELTHNDVATDEATVHEVLIAILCACCICPM